MHASANAPAFELLFSPESIQQQVARIARRISEDYVHKRPVFVAVLKGAFVFLSDLVRAVTLDADIDFVQISTYGASKVSSGNCLLKKDTDMDMSGRDVLIVEDIIDTGLTVAYLRNRIMERNPASVKICCLVDKRASRACALSIDYSAFTLQEGFVVGYGLDFDEKYRGLPGIYTIVEHE